MFRKSKVNIDWTPDFAYAIGLIATDGNVSPDGRHISFTSKDIEQIVNFKNCLGLKNKIGRKSRGGDRNNKKYFVVQFGDKNFCEFLNSIGLFSNKSKEIRSIDIPDEFFRDFLRGCIDGDGNIDIFSHHESKHPQLRIRLVSASGDFLQWMHDRIKVIYGIGGGWISAKNTNGVYTLSFGKSDSISIFKIMYYDNKSPYLTRKYEKCNIFGQMAELARRASLRS